MPGLPKIFADENVSHLVVEFLRLSGCDVTDVKELGWCGRDDLAIIRRARKERRLIVTHDRDFGTLAIARGEPCHGILYLRLKDQRAGNVIRTIERLLHQGVDLRRKAIVVLAESGVRIRDLR